MSEFWQVVLMKVLDVLIPLLVPALIAWIVGVAAKTWRDFKESKPDLAWDIENAAMFAVRAAEQLGLTEQALEVAGKVYDEKLDYAIDIAERYLNAKGFGHIDLDVLRAAIEAEVLKQFPKQIEKPAE